MPCCKACSRARPNWPFLVPTAPAILGAVHHATGVRAYRVPLLPHRLRAAIVKKSEAERA